MWRAPLSSVYYDGVLGTVVYSAPQGEVSVDLYRRFPGQKIEGLIRTVLDKYRTDASEKESKSRIINIALSNSIVPAHYLKAFFEFVYDIYKFNFYYTLVDDLY